MSLEVACCLFLFFCLFLENFTHYINAIIVTVNVKLHNWKLLTTVVILFLASSTWPLIFSGTLSRVITVRSTGVYTPAIYSCFSTSRIKNQPNKLEQHPNPTCLGSNVPCRPGSYYISQILTQIGLCLNQQCLERIQITIMNSILSPPKLHQKCFMVRKEKKSPEITVSELHCADSQSHSVSPQPQAV